MDQPYRNALDSGTPLQVIDRLSCGSPVAEILLECGDLSPPWPKLASGAGLGPRRCEHGSQLKRRQGAALQKGSSRCKADRCGSRFLNRETHMSCAPTKSVLFVDDELKVLDGLRRLLFPLGDLWRMEFACGGIAALELLAQSQFDVIVTDLRMPGMDGTELLSRVARDYPQMVRVILSGTCQEDLRLMAAMTAHQYLSKPCDADVLQATLERAFALRNVLAGSSLRKFISRTASLPSTPTVYTELIKALRAGASAQQLGAIVTRDVAMTAKVLQMVNSAFFGLRSHITNPVEAVSYLGTEAIAALALSVSAFSVFKTPPGCPFSIESLQQHSTGVAVLAQKIARRRNVS